MAKLNSGTRIYGTATVDSTLTVAAGSAGAPSIISTTGTADTGMWFPAADTLAASTAGTERMRIDSSGNVGIGTTSPVIKLDVQSSSAGTATGVLKLYGTNGSDRYTGIDFHGVTSEAYNKIAQITALVTGGGNGLGAAIGGALIFRTNGSATDVPSERLRIASGGNVGIGTSSPTLGKLQVVNTDDSAVAYFHISKNDAGSAEGVTILDDRGYSGVNSGKSLVVRTRNDGLNDTGAIASFETIGGSTLNALWVGISGRVLVNSASDVGGNNPAFSVNGDNFSNGMESRWTGTASFYNLLIRNGNGLIGGIQTSGSTTSFLTSSDYRLKNTITPMTGALDKVALLKPVTYKWNVDGSDGQGFIAHELAEVEPNCVTGEKDATREEEYEVTPAVPAVVDADGVETTPAVQAVKSTRTVPSYQGVDTSFLVATLTAAIQELKAIIDTQATRIAALEAK